MTATAFQTVIPTMITETDGIETVAIVDEAITAGNMRVWHVIKNPDNHLSATAVLPMVRQPGTGSAASIVQ
ncbi:hypothetical protein TKWG_13040 [Advenella kashmirensis WT001]|uniref:Uncharacterized protein n=1 Tax=Advenella kashmirensis (strain DSM 17095 / LMG 22695 / WT001) TaxID=1036672 RepID=I3UCJ8_ADVKW|nr:hypothetical protein [Advenella kashmirensis]AFK62736.1 hypothetical protein TKWG_13040 [Advenella kashmirensis WT001]